MCAIQMNNSKTVLYHTNQPTPDKPALVILSLLDKKRRELVAS
jgi:hypothetical protein